MTQTRVLWAAVVAMLAVAPFAQAQRNNEGPPPWVATEIPEQPGALPLYPAGAPAMAGAANQESWGTFGTYYRVVRNVTEPTITPYLPHPSLATGAAVVVAPGGAFLMLAYDGEGDLVARWLAAHGVAAFLLKYRVQPTPADQAEMERMGEQRIASATDRNARGAPPPTFQPAVDDAIAALRMIRANAAEWNVDPERVGMVGFSAGAMNTLATTLAAKDGATPDFIGLIYGPMSATEVPRGAPPLFAAMAADDPLFASGDFGLLRSWRDAGSPYEFHLYHGGGHGFGLRPVGTTATMWPEQFLAWMGDLGFLNKPPGE
ncbi:MAG: alpha/beta hydrolase [Gammaproteobacteria bacterium]|nr:alpha/beta hydrolase [Gammaproteobacteria bacterium]